jgi:hypothetical protein
MVWKKGGKGSIFNRIGIFIATDARVQMSPMGDFLRQKPLTNMVTIGAIPEDQTRHRGIITQGRFEVSGPWRLFDSIGHRRQCHLQRVGSDLGVRWQHDAQIEDPPRGPRTIYLRQQRVDSRPSPRRPSGLSHGPVSALLHRLAATGAGLVAGRRFGGAEKVAKGLT